MSRRSPTRHRAVKPPGRVSQAVAHATRRLEGHTLALGIVVALIGAALAVVAWQSVNGVPFQDRYTLKALIPEGSPIVAESDAVRISGQLAGLVTDVEPEDGATQVTMELRPAFAPVGNDAEAVVRVRSLVYLTYVEIHPGNVDDPMPEGGTIPVERSGSNVDLLEVVELFDRRARETLQKSIYNSGVGLAGRGGQLNAALHDLPAITRYGTPQLDALTPRPGALAELIRGEAAVFRGLGGVRTDDVGALIGSSAAVLATVAGRSAELGEAIELSRPFNDELLATAPLLDPVLEDATALSVTLTPVLDQLELALPELNRALALGDELRIQTDRLTGAIRPVLRAAAPVIRALEPTVASIDPLLESLDQLLDTVNPFEEDITRSAQGMISATTTRFEGGQTASGNPALRFSAAFAPPNSHRCREPFPDPGETLEHSCR
jgi:phospholipid/cholesterol/gamma-HCH transport system substrate-binding protein